MQIKGGFGSQSITSNQSLVFQTVAHLKAEIPPKLNERTLATRAGAGAFGRPFFSITADRIKRRAAQDGGLGRSIQTQRLRSLLLAVVRT